MNIRLLAAALLALPTAALADDIPITWEAVEMDTRIDPTGLWTRDEIREGGSVVQPSIHHATFAVDGGEVTISVLVDHWCGMSECPYKVRLVAPALGLDLFGEGMACQARDTFTYDPVALTITACNQVIDLTTLQPAR